MHFEDKSFNIVGTSFAKGSVVGTPASVAKASERSLPACVLIIRRHDSLKSIEVACALSSPVAAILEDFGPYSHQHWLCGYYDVPAIALNSERLAELPECSCLIDFDVGSVSSMKNIHFEAYATTSKKEKKPIEIPCKTIRSNNIRILAQINTPSDVEIAVNQGCDGFGEIKSSLQKTNSGKVRNSATDILMAIKLFELETDLLPIRYFDASPRYNNCKDIVDGTADSVLGSRGVRLMALQDDATSLFLKSLEGLEHSNFTVVLPMVSTISELRTATTALSMPLGRIGVQFETPMACLNADELLSEVAFAIIGLNDLTQYTSAWDRNYYHKEFTPPASLLPQVLDLAKNVCRCARQKGIPSAVAVDLYPTETLAKDLQHVSPDFVVVSPRRIQLWRNILDFHLAEDSFL